MKASFGELWSDRNCTDEGAANGYFRHVVQVWRLFRRGKKDVDLGTLEASNGDIEIAIRCKRMHPI